MAEIPSAPPTYEEDAWASLPFHSNRPRRLASGRARRSIARKLTASAVANKCCWICLGTDQDAHEPFVHACKCSLFAHERCLLQWITESQRSSQTSFGDQRKVVKCPQCQEPYTVYEKPSHALDAFRRLDRAYSKVAVRTTLGVAVGSLVYSSGAYGYFASRLFLGKQLSAHFFGPRLSWQACMNLPLVLPMLILARTSLSTSIIPMLPLTLVAMPWPIEAFSFVDRFSISGVPSPTALLVSLPWLQYGYSRLRAKLLSLLIREAPAVSNEEDHADVVVEINPNGDTPDDAGAQPANNNRNADRMLQETLVFGARAVTRLFLGSFILPFVSHLSGQLLLKTAQATQSKALRTILGLQDPDLWRLAVTDSDYVFRDQSSLAPPNRPEKIDPVWWRTTLGGCCFVLIKDTFSIWKALLELKQRSSRRIKPVEVSRGLELSFVDADNWRSASA